MILPEILNKLSNKEVNVPESIKLLNELKPINNSNYNVRYHVPPRRF